MKNRKEKKQKIKKNKEKTVPYYKQAAVILRDVSG